MLLKAAPPAPIPAAYDAFVAALGALDHADARTADAVTIRALWTLLGALGFEPSLRRCVQDGTPVEANGTVTFSLVEGGVLCERCTPRDRGAGAVTRLPARAHRDLLTLTSRAAPLPDLDAPHAAAHRRLVARFARHHVGDGRRPLFALDFWERQGWTASSTS